MFGELKKLFTLFRAHSIRDVACKDSKENATSNKRYDKDARAAAHITEVKHVSFICVIYSIYDGEPKQCEPHIEIRKPKLCSRRKDLAGGAGYMQKLFVYIQSSTLIYNEEKEKQEERDTTSVHVYGYHLRELLKSNLLYLRLNITKSSIFTTI